MGRIVLEAGPAPLMHGRAEIEEPLHRIVRGGQGEAPPGPENAQGLVEVFRGRPGVLDHLHEAHESRAACLNGTASDWATATGTPRGVRRPPRRELYPAGDEARARPEQGREEVEVASVPRAQIPARSGG